MNWLEWYRVVAYRDLADVPRQVLVANEAGDAFFILDAGDSPIYTIHEAGSEQNEAMAAFERHAGDTDEAIGCIPVEHVQFDDTGRKALKLTSPPIV